MNLAVLYVEQERVRKESSTFRGLKLTDDQVRAYETLKERIITNDSRVYTPSELGMERATGKTTVLLKLSEDFNIPLIVMNEPHASTLRRQYPGINIIGPMGAERLRGTGHGRAIVDELYTTVRLDPHIRIITGINGRNVTYGN